MNVVLPAGLQIEQCVDQVIDGNVFRHFVQHVRSGTIIL
jgi:hypothetical protein